MNFILRRLAVTLSVLVPVVANFVHAAEPPNVSAPTKKPLPAFKVTCKDISTVCLLVAPSTTDDQLVSLVSALRDARSAGTLGKLIPPTTPKAPRGPYQVVMVFVMSDAKWATDQRLKSFVNADSDTSGEVKEFGKRIRAYYYYTAMSNNFEEGSIGYKDENLYTGGHQLTSTYKKLF